MSTAGPHALGRPSDWNRSGDLPGEVTVNAPSIRRSHHSGDTAQVDLGS